MDKSWGQLVDRCQLFFDAPTGLYKALLKEAECELANKCSLFKQHFTILFRDNVKLNAFKLPSTYKEMISVHIDGDEIPFRPKNQFSFNAESNATMSVDSGEPDSYTVSNGFIVFDKKPTSGVADIHYRGSLQNSDYISKSLLIAPADDVTHNTNVCYVETTLGALLENYIMYYREGAAMNAMTLASFEGLTEDVNFTDPNEPGQEGATFAITGNDQSSINMQKYRNASSGWTFDVVNSGYVRTGIIKNYRIVGPVIDNDYHLSLCDYAIYVASAKKIPELSVKHQQIWEMGMKDILQDSLDKELNHTIKEVI
tara:strand:- start:895 stop:1833 length:939 start_codon:yes stop_codon:yes gene_type:complete